LKDHNSIPKNSLLENIEMTFDYVDTFNIQLERNDVQSWEPIVAFFQCSPKWANILFRIRNKVVKLFGLKADLANLGEMNPPFQKGDKFGLFNLYEINESEGILGEDDFHLDFRMSLQIDENEVLHLTTAIKFNNVLGKMYLAIIKPFHKLIVKSFLKKMALSIDKKTLAQYRTSKI